MKKNFGDFKGPQFKACQAFQNLILPTISQLNKNGLIFFWNLPNNVLMHF